MRLINQPFAASLRIPRSIVRFDLTRLHLSLVATMLLLGSPTSRADEKAESENAPISIDDQVKGEWVTYRDTPQGRFMTIKEHSGNRTLLTTYDPNKNPVYSHRSEYTIEETGNVYIFRYGNRVFLTGPDAGKRDQKQSAYLFRIQDDHFIEMHGMLKDDTGKPSMKIWQRLKKNPIAKPEA